jgi:hypothetical protein
VFGEVGSPICCVSTRLLMLPGAVKWWLIGLGFLVFGGGSWLFWRSRRGLRRRLKRILAKPFLTSVLIPAAAAIPPLFVACSDEKHQVAPAEFWKWVREIFDWQPWIRTAAMFWPIVIVVAAYLLALFRRRYLDLDELTAKQYGFMLQSLDDTVGKKMKRFAEAAERIRQSPPALHPYDIFDTITQPQKQREALINGIYLVFRLEAESIDPGSGDSITVKLAKMDEGSLFTEFEFWLPADQAPYSTAAELRRSECALSIAASTGKPLVIEDINKELSKKRESKFVRGAKGSSEDGSLLVYPVVYRPTITVPYVICLRSERKGHFRVAMLPRYGILLQSFLKRISMEHSLSLLKEYHARRNP